jgi:uncharacterized SAM-binding protein YcdF (DUF218 family)
MSRGGITGVLRPRSVVAALLAAVLLYLGFTGALIVRQSQRDEAQRADVIVVFGAAEYHGKPSPVYRARLDHAFELYERKLAPVIITTGGSGGESRFTEGSVGHDYLMARGVPDRGLIAETQGDYTAESVQRVANIMTTNGMSTCITVSDPYHEFRIKRMMEAAGRMVYASPRRLESPPGPLLQLQTLVHESVSYAIWRLHVPRL